MPLVVIPTCIAHMVLKNDRVHLGHVRLVES